MRDIEATNVKRRPSSRRLHRRSRYNTLYFALAVALTIGIAIALSTTLFFNVTDIVIENETDTPNERVLELSGIAYHDNLVRLDSVIASERIRVNIPYAEKVTIKKQFPSTVRIHVEKAKPVANIHQSYGYLLVSAAGRILELRADSEGACEGLIVVDGYKAVEGNVGSKLRSEDEMLDDILKVLTEAVTACGDEQIRSVDMTDTSDILVYFGENVVFHMGSSSDAAYKLRLASQVVREINPDKRYRFTMVGNNQISVLPEDDVPSTVPGTYLTTPAGTTTTTTTATMTTAVWAAN